MYNDRISVFENFHSEPKTITLGQWLEACKKGSRYTKQVLEYRCTGNSELKKSLPLVTVGALCNGGRKLENVTERTGWIALDIDGKDNPHLTDAKHIREEIAKIKNVAFAGLSTGGAGVWALVKVANPERQAEHFEMLIKDFERFGIVLDSSKGRNPNDARFYSYDPGAIIKDSFSIYTKLPKESEERFTPLPVHISNDYSRYAETALKNELEILQQATQGNRNNQLFKSSASLASLVFGGLLNEFEVRLALEQTAKSLGLKSNEINATLSSGFEAGKANPRTPDNLGQNLAILEHERQRDNTGERKFESRYLTPKGSSSSTGVMLNKQGYPSMWDELEAPKPGTIEYKEAEYYRAMDADPVLKNIAEIFNCELIQN